MQPAMALHFVSSVPSSMHFFWSADIQDRIFESRPVVSSKLQLPLSIAQPVAFAGSAAVSAHLAMSKGVQLQYPLGSALMTAAAQSIISQ